MAGRGEVGEVPSAQRVALFLEACQGLLVVDGVPDDDGVGDEVEAQGLVGLLLGLAFADVALVGEEQEAPQGV